MTVFALVKVKPGERVGIDRHSEVINTDDIWLAEKVGSYWSCVKPGYGIIDNYYGSGSAYAEFDQLEFLTPMVLDDSKLLDEYRHYM